MLQVLMVTLLFLPALAWAKTESHLTDYDKLDLSVTIKTLRSGNQNSTGINSYAFKITLSALPILKEEMKKTFAERQKIENEVGEFGQIQIKSLKHWIPDKKPNPLFSIAIKGDVMREIAAETMRKYKVSEDELSIFCRVEMFEKSRKFGFWGSDTKVGEASFPIIPESLPHGPLIENKDLTISDDTGTFVKLAVIFKNAEVKLAETVAPDATAPPKQ